MKKFLFVLCLILSVRPALSDEVFEKFCLMESNDFNCVDRQIKPKLTADEYIAFGSEMQRLAQKQENLCHTLYQQNMIVNQRVSGYLRDAIGQCTNDNQRFTFRGSMVVAASVSELAENIQSSYANSPDYSGLSVQRLKSAGILASDYFAPLVSRLSVDPYTKQKRADQFKITVVVDPRICEAAYNNMKMVFSDQAVVSNQCARNQISLVSP